MSKFPEITLVEALGSADSENKVGITTSAPLAVEELSIASLASGPPFFQEANGEMHKGSDSEARLSG